MVYAIYYTVVLHHRIVYGHIPNGYLKLCSHHLVYNICVAFVLRIMTASALPRAAPAAPLRSAPASSSRCSTIDSALPRAASAAPTRSAPALLSRCPAIDSALPQAAPAAPSRSTPASPPWHLMMYLAVRNREKGFVIRKRQMIFVLSWCMRA